MCKFFNFFNKNRKSNRDNNIKEQSVQRKTTKPEIILERFSYSPTGTFGIVSVTYTDFSSFSVEQPWRNNQPFVSCIPDGDYVCKWYDSPRFGKTLAVVGGSVSLFPSPQHQRDFIVFHLGNWPENFEGCIGLGREYTCVSGQIGVTSTRDTVNRFLDLFSGLDDIALTIKPKAGAIG